jgi:MFS family permease
VRTRIFYGWWVAVASGLGLGCSIATLVASTFGVYLGPLRAEFGWRASDAYLATALVTGVSALLAPAVGTLVDRIGARRMILASFVAVVGILASFYFLGNSLPQFYLRYVVLGVLGIGTTHIAFARVISLWFDRRRGLALGIALTGVGIGGVLWPLFCQYVIGIAGWRLAYVAQAAVIGFLTLPLLALVIRDTPQSLGLLPDGRAADRGTGEAVDRAREGVSLGAAVRASRYWIIIVAFFLIGLAVQSIMLHLVPMLIARGISPGRAAFGQSLIFLALVVGRLASGWLLDRFFAPRVALAFLIAPVAGIVMLALGAGGNAAFLAAILVGLAAGGEVDVIAYLAGRYYGLRHFSAIYGGFYGLYTFGGGFGGPLTARLAEGPAGYAPALWLNAALLLVACVLLTRLGPFPDSFQAPKQNQRTPFESRPVCSEPTANSSVAALAQAAGPSPPIDGTTNCT